MEKSLAEQGPSPGRKPMQLTTCKLSSTTGLRIATYDFLSILLPLFPLLIYPKVLLPGILKRHVLGQLSFPEYGETMTFSLSHRQRQRGRDRDVRPLSEVWRVPVTPSGKEDCAQCLTIILTPTKTSGTLQIGTLRQRRFNRTPLFQGELGDRFEI